MAYSHLLAEGVGRGGEYALNHILRTIMQIQSRIVIGKFLFRNLEEFHIMTLHKIRPQNLWMNTNMKREFPHLSIQQFN